jgi:small conductance mechanosensitive channel
MLPDDVGIALSLTLVIAALAALLARHISRRLLARRFAPGAETTLSPEALRSIRTIQLAVFGGTALAVVFPLLERAGIVTQGGIRFRDLAEWLLHAGIRVALIGLGALALLRFLNAVLRRFADDFRNNLGFDPERSKRALTLEALVRGTIYTVVTGIACLMILRELNIDILPVLTGAGIAGLAVGFGAQTLVKDVISGFFMILENQIRVGDAVLINGVAGMVEQVNLRTIVLRDLEGTVFIFPNGSITTLANRSRDYSYAVLDVGVAYEENPDRVVEILRQVGAELAADPAFEPVILEPLEVLGIEMVQRQQVTIKVRMKTLPVKQWDVARELRRRIKHAFDKNGIETASPNRTINVTPA